MTHIKLRTRNWDFCYNCNAKTKYTPNWACQETAKVYLPLIRLNSASRPFEDAICWAESRSCVETKLQRDPWNVFRFLASSLRYTARVVNLNWMSQYWSSATISRSSYLLIQNFYFWPFSLLWTIDTCI